MTNRTAFAAVLFAAAGGLLQFVAAAGLVLALAGAATGVALQTVDAPAMAAIEHSGDTSHAPLDCDDGVVCSPFFVATATGNRVFLRLGGLRDVSSERPFLRFAAPKVDLPPPRHSA